MEEGTGSRTDPCSDVAVWGERIGETKGSRSVLVHKSELPVAHSVDEVPVARGRCCLIV